MLEFYSSLQETPCNILKLDQPPHQATHEYGEKSQWRNSLHFVTFWVVSLKIALAGQISPLNFSKISDYVKTLTRQDAMTSVSLQEVNKAG